MGRKTPVGPSLSLGHAAWQRAAGLLCCWLKSRWTLVLERHCRQQRAPAWAAFCFSALNSFSVLVTSVSRSFGTVYKAFDAATGWAVSAKSPWRFFSSWALSLVRISVTRALGCLSWLQRLSCRSSLPRVRLQKAFWTGFVLPTYLNEWKMEVPSFREGYACLDLLEKYA